MKLKLENFFLSIPLDGINSWEKLKSELSGNKSPEESQASFLWFKCFDIVSVHRQGKLIDESTKKTAD